MNLVQLPDCQLALVGMANLPGFLGRNHAAIAAHGLSTRVVLTGELPHRVARALIAGCEVFVFTSTGENCPPALIEALSSGVAVASSDVGVMPEITEDAALLFDPNRPAIASALRRLLSDTTLCDNLRACARCRAATFAGAAAVARATSDAIENAASAEGRGRL